MKRLALVLAALAGCSSDSPTAAPPPPAPAAAPSAPAGNLLKFEVPAAWVKEEPANRMRKAQYRVPDKEKRAADAELVLFFFGARAGSFEENVSRWAGQMRGSQPRTETLQGKCRVGFVDLSGEYAGDAGGDPVPNARMLAAMVETPEGPWIFKLVGPADTVGDWRDELVALLKAAGK